MASSNSNPRNVDRLSTLPLPVLLRILSFLPTKYAVQTCRLSKRWEELWTSVPALDFDYDLFAPPFGSKKRKRSDGDGDAGQKETTHFLDFVDNVLMLRDGSDLHKFSLNLNHSISAACVNPWLRYAAKHAAKQIELYFCTEQSYHLPCQLFSSNALKDLKLVFPDSSLQLPTCVNLPNLESLELDNLELPGNSIENLLRCSPRLRILNLRNCLLGTAQVFDVSFCSCLESLSLEWTKLVGIKTINISAAKLKSLTIECSVGSLDCVLEISAPKLLYLTYKDHIVEEFHSENLPSLLNAVVHWNRSSSYDKVRSALEFLSGLKFTRTLRLHAFSMKILSRARDLQMDLSTSFIYLKRLELEIDDHTFQVVPYLLKCCTSVETLVIEGGGCGASQESDGFPHMCMLRHLKNVEVRQFRGGNIELELIKSLLNSAMVLETMVVTSHPHQFDQKRRKEIGGKLLTYPQASSKTLILFL